MRKRLPPLYRCGEDDTDHRMRALEAVLNANLYDPGTVRDLADRLYYNHHHGRGSSEAPPTADDLPVLRDVLSLVRDYAHHQYLIPDELTVVNQLMILGQFSDAPLTLDERSDGDVSFVPRRERVWLDGDVEAGPYPTPRKIAADLVATIQAIDDSYGAFRICRCPEEKCGRWFVAWHARRAYCSDECRRRAWWTRRKTPD